MYGRSKGPKETAVPCKHQSPQLSLPGLSWELTALSRQVAVVYLALPSFKSKRHLYAAFKELTNITSNKSQKYFTLINGYKIFKCSVEKNARVIYQGYFKYLSWLSLDISLDLLLLIWGEYWPKLNKFKLFIKNNN